MLRPIQEPAFTHFPPPYLPSTPIALPPRNGRISRQEDIKVLQRSKNEKVNELVKFSKKDEVDHFENKRLKTSDGEGEDYEHPGGPVLVSYDIFFISCFLALFSNLVSYLV